MTSLAQMVPVDVPKWMIYFSFVASFVLTLLKLTSAFKRPALALKLTPDLFFRLTEWGECLFCNPIYMAWNGPILILDVRAKLERKGSKIKLCPFKLIQFGEKFRGTGTIPEFYFHSTSPIQHVDEGKPQRVLYLLAEDSKNGLLKSHFRTAYKEGQRIREEALRKAPTALTDVEKTQLVSWITTEKQNAIDATVQNLLECVQLEGGSYDFNVEVEYTNATNSFLKPTWKVGRWLTVRTAKASLSFTVEDHVRELIRSEAKTSLDALLGNIISSKSEPFRWPEYHPIEVRTN